MNFADVTSTSHLGEIGNEQGPGPGSQPKTGETAAQTGNGRTPREALEHRNGFRADNATDQHVPSGNEM